MKKFVILTMAWLSMTATFAADGDAKATSTVAVGGATAVNAAYNMNVSMSSLSYALGLNLDQAESVADVHRRLSCDMKRAADAPVEERKAKIGKAIYRDLNNMRYILTEDQYRKYAVLLMTTLKNRGVIK